MYDTGHQNRHGVFRRDTSETGLQSDWQRMCELISIHGILLEHSGLQETFGLAQSGNLVSSSNAGYR